jgi:hypothetical protein
LMASNCSNIIFDFGFLISDFGLLYRCENGFRFLIFGNEVTQRTTEF